MLVSPALAAAPLTISPGSRHNGEAALRLRLDSSSATAATSCARDEIVEPVPDIAATALDPTLATPRPGPRGTLIPGIIISVLLHGVFIGYGGIAPQRPGLSGKPSIELSFRPVAPVATRALPVDAATVPAATVPKPRGRARAAVPALSPALAEVQGAATALQRAPRDDEKPDLARFDPVLYLPPSEVQRVALPINQELFDFLPLTGSEPGLWLVRLFIDEDGWVNEVEFVQSRGTERNADELRAILLANRFMPGLRDDESVKSQKMIEVSFEPGPAPRLTTPVLIPSVAEK